MKKLSIFALLAIAPQAYAQVPVDGFTAKLFTQNQMVKVGERRGVDVLRNPMDMKINDLLDDKKRQERVEGRILQLIYKDSELPCDEFKNPRMEKREWMNLVNDSVSLVTKTFSDALDANPKLKLAFLRDVEVMKHDPSCVAGENVCRLKLRATLELYTSRLSPNFPKEEIVPPRGVSVVDPEVQGKLIKSYELYQESLKEYVEKTAKGEKADVAEIFNQKAMSIVLRGKQAEPNSKEYRDAQLWAGTYKSAMTNVGNILTQMKNNYEQKVGEVIVPRKGGTNKHDPKRPHCFEEDRPLQYHFFNANEFMSVEVPIPEEKQQIIPCVEKISLREEHKLDVNFSIGSDVIEDQKAFREKVLSIFEGVKSRGYTVTGYQILASSSQVWGKDTPAYQARLNNLDLSTRRAKAGQKIVDQIPGFSELDHIPMEKLAVDEGVTGEKLKKVNINILGPATVPEGVDGKLSENKEKLYQALKPEFDKHGIFQSQDEYFQWLEKNKIKNVKDATFKPFQFFKIVVEAKKQGEGPCQGETIINGGNSKKNEAKSGSEQ